MPHRDKGRSGQNSEMDLWDLGIESIRPRVTGTLSQAHSGLSCGSDLRRAEPGHNRELVSFELGDPSREGQRIKPRVSQCTRERSLPAGSTRDPEPTLQIRVTPQRGDDTLEQEGLIDTAVEGHVRDAPSWWRSAAGWLFRIRGMPKLSGKRVDSRTSWTRVTVAKHPHRNPTSSGSDCHRAKQASRLRGDA